MYFVIRTPKVQVGKTIIITIDDRIKTKNNKIKINDGYL